MNEPVDPIQKAVDDYREMERKAKAWDLLCQRSYGQEEWGKWRAELLNEAATLLRDKTA